MAEGCPFFLEADFILFSGAGAAGVQDFNTDIAGTTAAAIPPALIKSFLFTIVPC